MFQIDIGRLLQVLKTMENLKDFCLAIYYDRIQDRRYFKKSIESQIDNMAFLESISEKLDNKYIGDQARSVAFMLRKEEIIFEGDRVVIPENEAYAIANVIEEALTVIRAVLKGTLLFGVTKSHGWMFDPSTPLFGEQVRDKFPSATFELDEAGKCMAVGRATAAAFHLLRTVELGIHSVRHCFGISDPIKEAQRNWGGVLRLLKEAVDPQKGGKAISKADREFFDDVYASIDGIKNAWRNSTMHVEKKYTIEEADHILSAVKGFMQKVASRCDENGSPAVKYGP